MGTQFSRQQVLERLGACVKQRRPLLAVCAGSGLNAKLCELGGTDLLTLVHTGLIRQKGLPSIAELDQLPNDVVQQMIGDQFAATKAIPITCGIEVGGYPADGNLEELLDVFMRLGFSGVMNYPSSGEIGSEEFLEMASAYAGDSEFDRILHAGETAMLEQCRQKEAQGRGWARELELIKLCRQKDIFSIVYVFSPRQAREMAQSGADCICGHCGGTAGGLVGHKVTVDYETAAARLEAMFNEARAVNPEVILLGHGGPFSCPEDMGKLYSMTSAQGFIAGSAVDRIPVEKAILEAVNGFKNVALGVK